MTRIAVVDDSRVDQMLIAGLLRFHSSYQIQFAKNGKDALEQMQDALPDLVVTDLIMPEMDGLELVRVMKRRFPRIPVILMTAHGSESIAVRALEAGAASYVPKAEQADRLLETVKRVLAHARADRNCARLIECVTEYRCTFSLDNDPALIPPLVNEIQYRLSGIGLGDAAERVRTAVALEEAILNAMYHGNLEISAEELIEARSSRNPGRLVELIEQRRGQPKYRGRKIRVDAHITAQGACFVIRDSGEGFKRPPHHAREDGSCFETGRGRGLMLIQSLMDEVSFNRAGNEVKLLKMASPPFAPRSTRQSDIVFEEGVSFFL